MDANLVNSIGLLCDIAGVILIWSFGLPGLINSEGEIITTGSDERFKRVVKRYDRLGKCGLTLLIVGFALQLWSNFL